MPTPTPKQQIQSSVEMLILGAMTANKIGSQGAIRALVEAAATIARDAGFEAVADDLDDIGSALDFDDA